MIRPLTVTQINALKPQAKSYEVQDGKNLFICVTPNGTKSFYFRYYRPFTGQRTKIALGRYPTLTLEQARRKREELARLVMENIDPQQAKAEQTAQVRQQAESTFKKTVEKWLDFHASTVAPRTANKNKRTIEAYLLPYLGEMQLQHVTPVYVVDFLKKAITKAKQQGQSGTMVFKAISLLNQILDYAVNCGLIEFNKCRNIIKAFPPLKGGNMATIKADELPQFLATLNESTATEEITKYLMKWQILTMTRPTESRLAKWEEIDLDRQIWLIPAERMKTNKPHSVPLNAQMLKILHALRIYSGDKPYIFASTKKRFSPLSDGAVGKTIHRIGYGGKQTAHGFRSLASTYLNETLLFSPDVIEAALSHSVGGEIRRIYNRSDYLDERRTLMKEWGDFCEKSGMFGG